MVEQSYYQSVLYVIVESLNLLKKNEEKGLLSNLGLKTPLSRTPLLGDAFF